MTSHLNQMTNFTLRNLRRVASFQGIHGVISYYGTKANRRIHEKRNHTGMDVMSEDWDNLFILDGCRYDLFAEECDLDGHLKRQTSPATESGSFIEESFIGRELHDTVYVTTNPYTPSIPEGTFHAILNLLETDWNEELKTVPPEIVAARLREAFEEFPNKRLIGHFMQPHYPFIGETGQAIESGAISPEGEEINETKVWTRLQFGLGVDRETVWKAFAENLRLALDEIQPLLDEIQGRTVLTADHGNLVGDRCWPIPVRGYGHPSNLFVDGLVSVPWFVVEDNTRREITSDPPVESDRLDDGDVESRLEALGYR